MQSAAERSPDSLNETTKEILKEKAKSQAMGYILHIKEENWEKNGFLENVQRWLKIAESLDRNAKEGRKTCEVLSLWGYLVEILRSICFYSSEELEKAQHNIKEIVRAMNSLSTSSAGIFFLSTIAQINQQAPFKGELSPLADSLENAYASLLAM